jgi:type I restriction enzyme, S subunit
MRRAVAVFGDILITVKGSGVGKLNVVDHTELAISRQLMAIRPIGLLPAFLFLALKTMYATFQGKSVGIAIPGIGRDDVLNTVLALPPLAEQHRIVARVEQLRSLCAGLRERLQLSRATQSRLSGARGARAGTDLRATEAAQT